MSRPIFFLFFLICIILFLLGVRVGNNVKETDRKINQKPMIITSVKDTPTFAPLEYKTYKLSRCNETFTLSNLFEQKSFASDEARFSFGNQNVLISCNQKTIDEYQNNFSTQEAEIITTDENKRINLYVTSEGVGYTLKSTKDSMVLYSIPKSLLNLFATN